MSSVRQRFRAHLFTEKTSGTPAPSSRYFVRNAPQVGRDDNPSTSGRLIPYNRRYGAPGRSSVLGPTLGNVAYDDVLSLDLPEGAHTIAYADDIALPVEARSIEEVEEIAQDASDIISHWMRKTDWPWHQKRQKQ